MQIKAQSSILRFLAAGAVISLVTITALVFGLRRSSTGYNVIKTDPSQQKGAFSHTYCSSSSAGSTGSQWSNGSWEFVVERDGDNYGLSEEQCRTAFPKLFVEIEKSVFARREKPISYKELDEVRVDEGMVRAFVHHGELYIVDFQKMPATYSRARATLNSLHRALTSFPDRSSLPSIEFVFTTEDFAGDQQGPIWAYSKRDQDEHIWMMPDFGYWSWPEVKIGPYKDIRRRIAAVDDGSSFNDKKKQLVWRGSLATNPELRSKFLKSTLGRSWTSVRVIDWDDENDLRFNLLPMEEHCRYMFLAHTEGRSFSGRGKYLFNCRSVVISHTLVWREVHHAALISSGPDANYVEVQRDFSDLERKIEYLIDHPETAERIANNAIRTFRDRYLTPAAESCYWRQLIRGYASVCAFEPSIYTQQRGSGQSIPRGVPFETWVLQN